MMSLTEDKLLGYHRPQLELVGVNLSEGTKFTDAKEEQRLQDSELIDGTLSREIGLTRTLKGVNKIKNTSQCSNCSCPIDEISSIRLNQFVKCSVFDTLEQKLVKMEVKIMEVLTKLFLSEKYKENELILNSLLCSECVGRLVKLYSLYNEYISLSALSNSVFSKLISRSGPNENGLSTDSNFSLKRSSAQTTTSSETNEKNESQRHENSSKGRHSTIIERDECAVRIQPVDKKIIKEDVNPRTNVELDLGIQSKDEIVTCDRCLKTFKSMTGLKVHYASHVRDDNKFQCTECDKKFRKKEVLQMHIDVEHKGFKPHKCPHEGCGRSFRLKDKLKLHIQVVHDKRNPFPCPKCEKSFRTNYHLKVHDVSYHVQGDNSFGCSKCRRKFQSSDKLHAHMKIHEEDKPCICTMCGKGFQTETRLKLHEKSHGQPSCICPICGKAYKHARDLRLHEATHQDESSNLHRFACGDCPKKFYRVELLRVHQANLKHFSKEVIGPSISKVDPKTPKVVRKNRKIETVFDEELQIFHEIETVTSTSNKKSKIVPKLTIRRAKNGHLTSEKEDELNSSSQSTAYQPNLDSTSLEALSAEIMGTKGENIRLDGDSIKDLTSRIYEMNEDEDELDAAAFLSGQRNVSFSFKDHTDRNLPSFLLGGAEQIGFDVINEFMNNFSSEDL